MERLTERLENGIIKVKYESQHETAIHRLAAIEDVLGDDYDLDRLATIMNQRMSMREDVAERWKITSDIPLDRLRELAQADREGQCWAFPCKVYDDVFINFWGRTLQATIVSISQIASTPNFRAMIGYQLCYIFKMDDIGKTVFLTREEAEAALKEREKE